MSRVRITNMLSRCSGGSQHGRVNLLPPDVYPLVGAVTVGCVMGVGIMVHTATKPNNGVHFKGIRLRKSLSKGVDEANAKLEKTGLFET